MNDEQTLLEWTLSQEEIEFISANSRGSENKLMYAAQFCHVKTKGRFVDNWGAIGIKILNHLSKQLSIDLVHEKLKGSNKNTESRIRLEIKKLLNLKDFEIRQDKLVAKFLDENPVLITNKLEITREIEKYLISAKYILPRKNQLMRFVNSQYNKKQSEVFKVFASKITKEQKACLKEIYENNKLLPEIKTPIGDVNVKNIMKKIEVVEKLLALNLEALPWKLIHPSYSDKLARFIHKCDHRGIRRIKPEERRDVMVICYLYENSKTMMDLLVNSYDKLMVEIERRVNKSFDTESKKLRKEARSSREQSLEVLSLLDNHQSKTTTTLKMFCDELRTQDKILSEIINNCRKAEDFEKYGKSELGQRRYSYLKELCSRFLALKFKNAKGIDSLMRGIEICRNYQETGKLPKKVPYGFIDSPWKEGIYGEEGKFNRKAWEIGLYFAVKKGLKSGDLYLPQSRYYRDFWSPMYNEKQWKKEKADHYKELNVPEHGKEIIIKLKQEFAEQLYLATRSFGYNHYAEVKNKKLVIHSDDALPDSESVKELRGLVDSYITPIRIEELLSYTQRKTNYMRAFKALEGDRKREGIEGHVLNAAITGHATNLGLYGISKNCKGIKGEKLSYASNHYMNAENLKEASNILIEAQQSYWLTKIIGSGERSSSDGERFITNKRGLYSSIHPRYFGALDRGITIYTHMSDQCSVFNTEVISCGLREAVYVLDGLLDNQSIVRPFEHSTDTAGFTEIVFALCYLLGISFQPHFRDLKDQQLYCFDRKATSYPEIFSRERINEGLIEEQWDDIIRLVCSLKNRLIKPHIIVKKLQAQEGSTKLAKALIHLGRIVKSTYILRYLHDIDLRYWVRKQLNRGEQRHGLGRYVFFANQGAFRTNDYEEMMNKASCLSFVSNAIVLWNTEQMQMVYEDLAAKGHKIPEEDMQRVLPLSTKSVLVHGTYSFEEIKDEF